MGLVIDFGCGTGRASLKIEERGCEVIAIDFASNCLDHTSRGLRFFTMDLSKPMPFSAPYGFCTDVLEHIPTAQIGDVISNIMACAKTVFFQVSTVNDIFGQTIGTPLHLTVQQHGWWIDLFETMGYTVTYDMDRGNASLFVVSRKVN